MKSLRFTAVMGSFGKDLDAMSEDELKRLLELECGIPRTNIENVEVR